MEDLKRGGYVKKIAAAAGHTGYKDQSGGSYVPFRLYLAATSTVVFTTVDDDATAITYDLGAGYHDIGFATLTSTSTVALVIYERKPKSA
jgi:hypothetical protein